MAMNTRGGDEDEMITEINVTPFVDVVLVLLILFMLAAPAVYQSGLKLKLPQAVAAEKMKHVTLRFSMTAAGDVFLDQEKLATGTIKTIVKKAMSLDPAADAMISADESVTHGKVLTVLDAIKSAGIHEVAFGAAEIKPKGT